MDQSEVNEQYLILEHWNLAWPPWDSGVLSALLTATGLASWRCVAAELRRRDMMMTLRRLHSVRYRSQLLLYTNTFLPGASDRPFHRNGEGLHSSQGTEASHQGHSVMHDASHGMI